MEKCKLCLVNEANQTGSHIFTLSLIKSAINQVGKTGRGQELTFGISSEEFLSLFFGQGILPEKLEEILDKEVTEEEIEQNENPFTIDNLVCTNCEKRFTTAENYFFNEVQTPLNEKTIELKEDRKHGKYLLLDEPRSLLTRLYFYIQIWRSSAANYEGFRLDANTEEKLRRIINSTLTLDLPTTTANVLTSKYSITSFPIVINHAETIITDGQKEKLTENVVCVEQYKEPHFFILNDFYIQFYCNSKHTRRPAKFFFGVNDVLGTKKVINEKEDKLILSEISDDGRKHILRNLYKIVAELVGRNYARDFAYAYYMEYGRLPSPKVLTSAINLLVSKYKV